MTVKKIYGFIGGVCGTGQNPTLSLIPDMPPNGQDRSNGFSTRLFIILKNHPNLTQKAFKRCVGLGGTPDGVGSCLPFSCLPPFGFQ